MGFLEKMLSGRYGSGHHGGHYRGRGDGRDYGPPPVSKSLACQKCGAQIATDSRFCGQCGSSTAPKACSECKAALAADANFCGKCGSKT